MIQLKPDVTIRIDDTTQFAAEGWCFADVVVQVPNPDHTGIAEARASVQIATSPGMTVEAARAAARSAALALWISAAQKLASADI